MTVSRPAIPRSALDVFTARIAAGATVGEACRSARIGRRTAYDYRTDDPEFRASWDAALEASIDALDQEARARALDRADPESARLLQFLLRGRRRHVYGDRLDVSATLTAYTGDQLAAFRRAAALEPEAFERAARALAAPDDDEAA